MLIHVVADYGPGDLAFAEVHQRLATHVPGCSVVNVPVAPFDTVAGGFCVAQLARNTGPTERAVYANIAPRADDDGPREDNEGEPLVAVRLTNGVLVVAVHAGSTLSFLRDAMESAHLVAVPTAGSQFRSRDLFPEMLARLLAGDPDALAEPLDMDAVPEPPTNAVLYVDGYGNLKTGLTALPAESGTTVHVRIGDVTRAAVVSDGTFEVGTTDLSLAPGSSGWPCPEGDVRFLELLLRGASAAEWFRHPTPGTRVEVRTA